jgi:hypothetical protein
MPNIVFLKAGAPTDKIELSGDQSTSQALVVSAGAAAAGQSVVLTTSAPLFIDKVKGVLDSQGKFAFILGPSFGAKGDATITAQVKNKSKSLDVRFI